MLFALTLLGTAGCGDSAADRKAREVAAERTAGVSLPAPLRRSKGATRYVATSGSDRNPGTRSRPWRTVQRALDRLRPGQTAIVRAGVYRQNLVAERAGRRTAPITIRGQRGAVLAAGSGDGDNVPLGLANGAAYLRFQGFVIEGATGSSTTDIYAFDDAHDIEVSDCEVRRSARQGFFSEATTRRIQILRCWFHDNGGRGPENLDHNIYVEGRSHVIAGNLIEGARNGSGIQVYPSTDRVTVAGNTIVGNALHGIILGGGGDSMSNNALIVNNILAGNKTGIATVWDGDKGTGNVARRNLAWRNSDGGFTGDGITYADNLKGDPRFVNASKGDYRLGPRSAAAGRALRRLTTAVDINRHPRGQQRDLGAYER